MDFATLEQETLKLSTVTISDELMSLAVREADTRLEAYDHGEVESFEASETIAEIRRQLTQR